MAEIVGLIASVLQLVDTLAEARDYITGFRDAPKDKQRLFLEIQNLQSLQLEDPLMQLKGTMERLTKKLSPADVLKVSNRLTWPLWGKEDVQEGLDSIERFKSLLNAWLEMNIWNSTQGKLLVSGIMIVSLRNKDFHTTVLTYTERAKIIEWFSPLSFFLQQADIFNTCQPGTGGWLLEHSLFKAWKSRTGNLIWCRGMPDAGKTVLASIVIDDLRETLEGRSVGVAVIYLNHKETEAQSPSNLLAGLWPQLIFDKPISPTMHRLYVKHCEQRTRPSLEEIASIVSSTILELSSIFIVVDALDEYPEQQRSILLRHLSSLGSSVSLMLTSRPHINLNHVAENFQILEIRAAEDDIRRYIDAAILKSSRLSRHIENRPALRGEIEEIIVQRSDGMFLLAKLHIDSLITKHTVKAVRDALTQMPDNLNSTYDEVVERINRQSEDDKALAWCTLSWVTNAKRPLRPSELREAIAVEPETTKLDSDNILDLEIILSVCAGLVVINDGDKRLRLIHYSTQKYLERVQSRLFPHAATEIATTCITYLSFDTFSLNLHDPMPLFHRNPFLDYAVQYCLIHARGQPESHIKQLILAFLVNCLPWWKLWNWKHAKEPKSDARLWIASLFHLEEICQDLIQEDGHIYEAALDGLTGIVKLLIDHGVDVNAKGVDGTALYIAAGCGHYDVAQLLIKRDAEVNAECGSEWPDTALGTASLEGHQDIVSLLLEQGAAVNVGGGRHGSPLGAASSAGHGDVVRVLLEHGADVNASGILQFPSEAGPNLMEGHPLYAALMKGQIEVVRLLIKYGADTKSNCGQYPNALHAAVTRGKEEIAVLLIDHGVDVNARGVHGTALYIASRCGQYNMAQLLIKHGAEVNAKCEWDETALGTACLEGHQGIVRLLVEHGADVNSGGERYGSPLGAASWVGHEDVVRLLLERGADISAKGEYGNPLQTASSAGARSEKIVRLLIEHGTKKVKKM
ncbi:ankyrin repeat-containing domain protein [Mycena latifolia]|nr:ankyrin repeat-containing domain protein [Mycena latifolia]